MKPVDCIANDFSEKWYKKWAAVYGFPPGSHAKFWEMAAISEFLDKKKLLRSGVVGLGMGVGGESLVAAFASRGVTVVATDQDPEKDEARKWDNGQLANGKEDLFYEQIVNRDVFEENVTYQSYDMNKTESRFYDKFDFIWHNCVVGHLGSMDRSINHLKKSAKYLKDDGWLVFTTELNISSFEQTISDKSDTIIWRLDDVTNMFEELAAVGLATEGLNARMGASHEDRRINYNYKQTMQSAMEALANPLYSELKIPFSNFAITQILLCFQKKDIASATRALQRYKKKQLKKNYNNIAAHRTKNRDLQDYQANTGSSLSALQVIPTQRRFEVHLAPYQTKEVAVDFVNTSNERVFDYSLNTPHGIAPLVVGTNNPVNRPSVVQASSWSSENRPALAFSKPHTAPIDASQPFWNEHRAEPGESFRYKIMLKAPAEQGVYSEDFTLISEGVGAVRGSEFRVVVNVSPAHVRGGGITPDQVKELLGGVFGRYGAEQYLSDFQAYLHQCFATVYKFRSRVSNFELPEIVASFLVDGQRIAANRDEVVAVTQEVIGDNDVLVPKEVDRKGRNTSEALFIFANPRSGNNAVAQALHNVTGWARDSTTPRRIDVESIDEPLILIHHLPYQRYVEEAKTLHNVPHKTITIARNPYDVILSAFRFNQKSISCYEWLGRTVFPSRHFAKDKTPLSSDFLAWATSEGAASLLKTTTSWLAHADVIARYEDFIAQPEKELARILEELEYKADQKKIAVSVSQTKNAYLKDNPLQHRWLSSSETWKKFITKDVAEAIYEAHKEVFIAQGYKKPSGTFASTKQIQSNIEKLW